MSLEILPEVRIVEAVADSISEEQKSVTSLPNSLKKKKTNEYVHSQIIMDSSSSFFSSRDSVSNSSSKSSSASASQIEEKFSNGSDSD